MKLIGLLDHKIRNIKFISKSGITRIENIVAKIEARRKKEERSEAIVVGQI